MRIYIWDFTHDRYYPLLTNEQVTVQQLLSQIVPQIVKERGPGRQIVAYLQKTGDQLIYNTDGTYKKKAGTGQHISLHPWQALGSAGVNENEVLVLCYFIQPGTKQQNLIDQRLKDELTWLKEVEAASDIVKIEPIEGDSPRKYMVTLKCKGLMLHPGTGKPCMTVNHILEIYLPSGIPGYPIEAPYVRCITPHFHPNISADNNLVCLGVERAWESKLNIAWLITHLVDMITYRSYGLEKPYNLAAAKWVESNTDKLPVDKSNPLNKGLSDHSKEPANEPEISFQQPLDITPVAIKAPKSKKLGTGKPADPMKTLKSKGGGKKDSTSNIKGTRKTPKIK